MKLYGSYALLTPQCIQDTYTFDFYFAYAAVLDTLYKEIHLITSLRHNCPVLVTKYLLTLDLDEFQYSVGCVII